MSTSSIPYRLKSARAAPRALMHMPADRTVLEAKLLIAQIRPAEKAVQHAEIQSRNAGFNKAVTACGTLRICLTDLNPNPYIATPRVWVETSSFQQVVVELLTRIQIELCRQGLGTSAHNKHLETARRRFIRATPLNTTQCTIHQVRASPIELSTLQEIWAMAQAESWAEYDSEAHMP